MEFQFYSKKLRIPKDILALLDPRHRSDEFRRSLRNSSWSLVDYLLHPILLVPVTPFLVFRLGVERFGIWMLVSAVTGAMGVFSLGLGDATIKYVSSYRALGNLDGMKHVVRSTQTVDGPLGIVSAGTICLCAPLLARHAFQIERAHLEPTERAGV